MAIGGNLTAFPPLVGPSSHRRDRSSGAVEWQEINAAKGAQKTVVRLYHLMKRARLTPRVPLQVRVSAPATQPSVQCAAIRLDTSTWDLGLDLRALDQVRGDYFRLPEFTPRQAAVVVDVGARAGLYALSVCAIEARAVVYAFEPMPDPYRRLVSNCRLNRQPRISCENLALGARDGIMRSTSEALQGTFQPAMGGDRRTTHREPLPMVEERFDEYARRNGVRRVDLVKIDAVGAEQEILLGMEHSLQAVDRLVVGCQGEERRQWCRVWLTTHQFRLVGEFPSIRPAPGVGIQYYVRDALLG